MCSLSHSWDGFQQCLLDVPEEAFPEGLTRRHGQFMWLLEVVPVRQFVGSPWRCGRGRPQQDRRALLRAFLAKAWFNFPTTVALRDRLLVDRTLRQLCGWEQRREVPSEATFRRAYAAFARSKGWDELHVALVAAHATELLFWHLSRDSTPIPARERPQPPDPAPAATVPPPKRQRGRPRKGEEPPAPPPTRLQQQYAAPEQTAQQLAALPRACDWGCKKNAEGKVVAWKGYKLHVDTGDDGLPLLAVTTSASLHDSQPAIPMARTTAKRVTSLYDLMDSAYDAELIWHTSYDLQHVPIIAENPRRGPKLTMEPDRAERFKQRSGAERFNSLLKDCHGGRTVRVRGATKVHAHLMCGVLAIFVRVLARWPDG